jgi:hypothetical protein
MDEHAETRFSEPLHPLAILSMRFSVLDGTHRMYAACLNSAALKLRPGLQRVTYHSPGCSQGASLENASPGYLHAFSPDLKLLRQIKMIIQTIALALLIRACPPKAHHHPVLAGKEGNDGTPALFKAITV